MTRVGTSLDTDLQLALLLNSVWVGNYQKRASSSLVEHKRCRVPIYAACLQEAKTACKRAQLGRDKAESRCAELEGELESQKAAAHTLRQVSPLPLHFLLPVTKGGMHDLAILLGLTSCKQKHCAKHSIVDLNWAHFQIATG